MGVTVLQAGATLGGSPSTLQAQIGNWRGAEAHSQPAEPNLHQLSSAFRATLLSSGLGIQVLSSVVPQTVYTNPDLGILQGRDLPSKHA